MYYPCSQQSPLCESFEPRTFRIQKRPSSYMQHYFLALFFHFKASCHVQAINYEYIAYRKRTFHGSSSKRPLIIKCVQATRTSLHLFFHLISVYQKINNNDNNKFTVRKDNLMRDLRFSQRCCWITKSFGIWRRVAWKAVPTVQKDHCAFIFRVM